MTNEELDKARAEEAYRLVCEKPYLSRYAHYRALVVEGWTPAPAIDPLVDVFREYCDDQLDPDELAYETNKFKTILAKHNLAIVEMAREVTTQNPSISAGEQGEMGAEVTASIDPLLLEAREICASYYDEDTGRDADEFRRGDLDWYSTMEITLEALKRGMEIARVQGDDETYKIGVDDGRGEMAREIDRATGGDGEYRYCVNVNPERHCPDSEAMRDRIIARFNAREDKSDERRGIERAIDWVKDDLGYSSMATAMRRDLLGEN